MISSSNKDASALDVFSACAEKGIAEYFKSTETVAALAEWLHEETRLPTPGIKVCLKLLAQGLELGAKKGGAHLGRLAKQRMEALVRCIPKLGEGLQRIGEGLGKLDKEADAKQKFQAVLKGQRPTDMAEFAQYLSLDLQAQLKELETLEEFREEVRTALESIQAGVDALLNPQPHLSLHLAEEDERYKFKFYTRWIPFLGRKEEWAALESFLESDRFFSWWLATGDAGSGKSRLALEFAMEHEVDWRAGFLDASGDIDWHTWQPERPTLLISDYAFREPEVLRKVAKDLSQRRDLDCPVRLLLLDRQAEGPWLDTFLGTRDRYRHAIEQARFEEQSLVLPPMEPEELRTLCLAIIAKLKVTFPRGHVEEVMELMERMGGRPLFVAFIADALARDGDPRKWDRDALLKDVLGREMDRWRDAGARDEDMTLLAFATMTGGLSAEDAGKAVEVAGDLLPKLDKRVVQVHSFMTGGPAEALKPLEPDILGELFVLDWLTPESGLVAQVANERMDALRKLAWRFSPVGMFGFITRTAADFPEHFFLGELAIPAEENEEQRKHWSRSAANLLGLIRNKQPNLVKSLYEAQKKLALKYDEPALRKMQAIGTMNLIMALGQAGEVERPEALYRELAVLASDHPKEPVLREAQAGGATNLIAALGHADELERIEAHNHELTVLASELSEGSPFREPQVTALDHAGEVGRVETLYSELTALVSGHPGEPALRDAQAGGAFNFLNVLKNAGEFGRAEALYRELAALTSEHSEEPTLRVWQAKGAYTLLSALGKAGEFERAEALYRELAVLAPEHSEEPVLRDLQAQGTVNLILALGQAGEHERAEGVYHELVLLASAHPDEPALRESQAKGALNHLNDYLKTGTVEDAESLYRVLVELASDHPEEPVLREQQANGAANLILTLEKAGEIECAEAYYHELVVLVSDHAEEFALQKPQAKGIASFISALGAAGEVGRAEVLYKELTFLALKYPEEPALREAQAVSAANLIADLGEASKVESAEALYRELANLVSNYSEESALRVPQAKGAGNCILALGKSGNLKGADSVYQELAVLAWRYPVEVSLTQDRLQGGMNLVYYQVQANQLDAARRRQAELLRLCQTIPNIPQEMVDQLQNMVPAE